MTISVLGGGAFGTALAVSMAQRQPVTLWARNMAGFVDGRSPRLPDVDLPTAISLTGDLDLALAADTILLAVPMQALGGLLSGIEAELEGKSLVACSKGVDLATLTGPSAVIRREKPRAVAAVLTGPSFAADIARGLPTALTLACADAERGAALQSQLATPSLRLYRSTDVVGAELGGALKNVIAIACGACIGLGLGESARAALMTRGFAEMTRLAAHLGGQPETLAGLSGFGDLALTCTSGLSRNYRYGLALGEGIAFKQVVTVEGVATAQAVRALAEEQGLDLPVTRAVAAISGDGMPVQDAVSALLSRSLKEE